MLSKRIVAIARARGGLYSKNAVRAMVAARSQFHTSTLLLEPLTVKVPTMAESITEGTLKQWQKKVGERVEQDEEVATIETDKIDVSVNAPQAGKVIELLVNEEDTVSIGQDLLRIEVGAEGEASKSDPQSKPTEEPKAEKQPQETEDVTEPKEQQVDKTLKAPPPPPEQQPKKEEKPKKDEKPVKSEKDTKAPPPPPPSPGSRSETRVKMNRMRLRIAERLKESQNTSASLTTFNEIDMSSLISFRSKYKDEILKRHDVKLGYMSAFAKACVLALQEIPAANASIEDAVDGKGQEVVYRDYVDLSVAVATPKGLVTPVVRNAEAMSMIGVEKEIAALGKKARDGKLTLEDMAGGTFTISNGGVFGSLYGTPIINLPQAAVLGMHAIKDKPVVVDGQIVIRPIMVVALTYDHRLLDGREAVTFLVRVKEYLEDPRKMLLVE
ncbi:dihydrolipoamide succinyltransferase [Ramaria rubella]|nr:dihydrolipoamide succinyltransferase [Ramaria rubella]